MIPANYHTHTKFCDGVEKPSLYIEEAIRLKLKTLGFSAHAPVPFDCVWTLPVNQYLTYKNSIETLKRSYCSEIEILCGLEIDYIPDLWTVMQPMIRPEQLDYFIGSIHFIDHFNDGTRWTIDGSHEEFKKGWTDIFDKDSHQIIKKYFEYTRKMIEEMRPPIIGHLDKIKMQHREDCFIDSSDSIYRSELKETLEAIKAFGCIVEVNTRGVYRRKESELYPGFEVLQQMAQMDIPVVISSDAHRPNELVNLFEQAATQLRSAGYKHTHYLTNGEWITNTL